MEDLIDSVETIFNQSEVNNTFVNTTNEDLDGVCRLFSGRSSHVWSEVLEGVLSIIVGVVGLVGNLSAICILRREEFKETFNKLLICLCVFDSLFIACAMLIYVFRAHRLYLISSSVIPYLFLIFYPSGNIALYGSIYTTLAISIERYRGITSPIRSRTEPKQKLIKYLIPVLLLSIGFNVPKMFESSLNEMKDLNNNTILVAQNTWLSRNIAYTHYYKVWSDLILTTIIPLSVLIFCNGSIVVTIRKSRDIQISATSANKRMKQEFALSMVLIGIVFVFFICHIFRFFLAFYRVSVTKRTVSCLRHKGLVAQQPEWLYAITAISHFMLTVNSSVNFLVYCVFGTRFRKALKTRRFIWFISSFSHRSSERTSRTLTHDLNETFHASQSHPKGLKHFDNISTHSPKTLARSNVHAKSHLQPKSQENKLNKKTNSKLMILDHSNTLEITEI
ncbi:FMRFamide receptor [Lepeophtheirus salmonis]|nr:FMRFamide receptor-like [Lepeophtheirus salmonis]XP_040563396.1 FMRFamide receptor-like [Lepeophtheirus salmonis]XP_040563403.1 FMRFamide receptor-like [Lepeophtheirus salmonis]XP_040563412.1 FMRFamide receptor-like [Lepeophtheirus salmonis]XP_040563419.1 FMRFamide receptor-like [Lepeophtheirus salmonis]XP_040563426.1 FMRFamide receptor-like [Lepeophtheirus salmonis]XP_040563434.1 FMRFamide receptor-like [Lepeophtheirus salmonis]